MGGTSQRDPHSTPSESGTTPASKEHVFQISPRPYPSSGVSFSRVRLDPKGAPDDHQCGSPRSSVRVSRSVIANSRMPHDP